MAKIGTWRSAALALAVLVACSFIADAARLPCNCGGLGPGKDFCKCNCGLNVPVKAAERSSPVVHASERAINAAVERRLAAERSAQAVAPPRYGCGGKQQLRAEERVEDEGPSADQLLAMDSSVQIAPLFKPVGDMCTKPKKSHSLCLSTVTPAHPGRPVCSCNGRINRRINPSVTSGSTYISAGGSGLSAHHKTSANSYQSSQDYSHDSKHQSGSCRLCGQNNYAPSVDTVEIQSASRYYPHSHGISHNDRTDYERINEPYVVSGTVGQTACSNAVHRGTAAASGSYSSSGYGSSAALDYATSGTALSFEQQEQIYKGALDVPAIPADPVSVDIAYRKRLESMQPNYNKQKVVIPEERLIYGPASRPADRHVKMVSGSNGAEEKLQIIERPIIEYKAPKYVGKVETRGCSEIRETEEDIAAMEALQRESEAAQSGQASVDAHVTYSDLGYAAIEPSKNVYEVTQATAGYAANHASQNTEAMNDGLACGQLGKLVSGYRPGTVIVHGGAADSYDQNAETNDAEDARSEEEGTRMPQDLSSSSEVDVQASAGLHKTSLVCDHWKRNIDYQHTSFH